MQKKMELKNQVLLVNTSILAGLVFEYIRGAPMLAIVITGILLFFVANVIFFARSKKMKKVA